jgi:hypothetical protein
MLVRRPGRLTVFVDLLMGLFCEAERFASGDLLIEPSSVSNQPSAEAFRSFNPY